MKPEFRVLLSHITFLFMVRLHIDVLHTDKEFIFEGFVGEIPVKGETLHLSDIGMYNVRDRHITIRMDKQKTSEVSLKVVEK